MTELNRIYEELQKIQSQIKHQMLSSDGPNKYDRGYESGFARAMYELKKMLIQEKVFSMKMGESLIKD